jgi:hypothetical protein
MSGLLALAVWAFFIIIDEKEKPIKYGVTRNAVPGEQVEAYNNEPKHIPTPTDTDWSAIMVAMTGLLGAAGTYAGKRFTSKFDRLEDNVSKQFAEVHLSLKDVKDSKYRACADTELKKIEYEALKWIKDNKWNTLIEGIGYRTRLFCRDMMQHNFDAQALEIAKVKIAARSYESDAQLKNLQLAEIAIGEIINVRTDALEYLIQELTILTNDKLFNDEYRRQAEIICNFQRKYMSGIIGVYFDERSRHGLAKGNT